MSSKTMRNRRNLASKTFSRSLLCSALAAVLASGAAPSARAADRYWDANGTAVGVGGAGTWNLGNLNWSPNGDGVSGPFVDPWDNAALDHAIFGGTAGTVVLGSAITAHDLTFNVGGYVLTGNTLTLGGATPTISTSSGTTQINSVVAGNAGLVKAGNGTLQLGGANTFSGAISILGGTLYGVTDAALGAAGNDITTAAATSVGLRIDGAGTSRSVTIGDGGTLTLSGAGVGAALIGGNGRVSVAASNNAATIVRLTNDQNSYTGATIFNACNGVCSAYFSSIGDLGELSSLGAPTTVADGTIIFNQSSQYSDNVVYIGDGDSSNRNWDINGSSAVIRNQGTGTLEITGDIDVSSGASFVAETGDFALLGTLSGGAYAFNASAGRSVTLGDANTFTGVATLTGLVQGAVLANAGDASSLGAGTDISLNNGTFGYAGTGGSSNKAWLVNNQSAISNDGTGALALSGGLAFNPVSPVADVLTLGGSFAGANSISGVISGNGSLVSDGAGTWRLDGANTFVGTVTVNSGVLRMGNADAFGGATGYTVNGGTFDLNGFDLLMPSIAGSGGTIALGSGALTVNATTAQSYGGTITGTGGLTKTGAGTLTLTGASSYIGPTTINGGRVALDFTGAGGPVDDILSASSPLVLSGGALDVLGANGENNSQAFDGLTVSAGSNTVRAVAGAGGSVDVGLGAITRTGGLVNFVLPDAGAISTSNADGVLGGWATIGGTDYAKVVGGNIVAFEDADYTNKDDAGTWLTGEIISDSEGAADSPFFGTVGTDVSLGGLRYTAAADSTVTIGAGNTLGVDGTIIVAPSVADNDQTITGGALTSGAGGGALGVQQNGQGSFTIGSTIVDNTGATSFVKGGAGLVVLNGANTYTGSTTVSAGTLRVSDIGDGGEASNLGASTADASNLVLEGGTLQYTGGTATTDRGFTLVNGGASRTVEVSNGAANLTFTGLVTSPDDAGLTKAGPGTLTLANGANDYVGVTTVSGGTLAATTLTDGGEASSIGAASSDPANIVLAGGTLAYTGGTTGSDRGMTFGGGGGGIGVSDAATTLTLSGILTGTALRKSGPGTLVLSGANTYTNGTTVEAGTLRAGAENVFGTGGMTVAAGTLLDLDGFDNRVNTLGGAGDIDLGAGTLTVNSGGTFTGTISGSGGLTRAGTNQFTLVLAGCNNTYTGATTITNSTTLSVDCLADGGEASGIGASSSAASNLVFGNGFLQYTGGSVVTDRGFTLASGAGVINVADAATTLEFTGAISGGGQLRKDGAGTLVLSGTNGSTGGTRVTAGTLRAGSTTALGSGALALDNATGVLFDMDGFDNSVAYLAGGGANGGALEFGGATLTLTTGSSLANANFGGVLTGSGNLVKNGGSTQQLSGCGSDYDGVTTINAGILAVACLEDGDVASSIGASSADPGNLVINGGTLQYIGAGGSTDRRFTLGPSANSRLDASGSGAIAFTSTADIAFSTADTAQTLILAGTNTGDNTLAARITDNGTGLTGLTKTGTGTWILTNSESDYTGVTTISGGVLGVDKLSNGGEASSIGASTGAASNLVIGNGSTLRYTGSGDSTNRLFTLASGVTFIESSGTGAVVFTDTGPVTLQGNNQARTIALGGTNTGLNTLAGSIGNAGTGVTTLAKNDSGTWVLTGDHSYTGSTNINDGLLYIGNGGTTGSIASSTVNNFGTLAFNRSNGLSFGGAIVGTGSVLQAGVGTTVLTGSNTYSGGTTIQAGRLQLGNGGATGSIVGDVVNNGTLVFNRNNGYAFDGVISGSGRVTQAGTGTTILSGNNSYAGGTRIDAGTLQVSSDANLGAATGGLTFMGGTLRSTADIVSGRDVALFGAGTLLTDAGTTFELGGTISGGGPFTKAGAGTLVLTADSLYSGDTTIAGGTLQLGDGGSSGWILGNVANDGALVFDRSDDMTFGGLVSGSGDLVQNGLGVLRLTGDNSYTGATSVNAGTLLVNGNQASATGQVTVQGGATLGGMGTIGGDVVVNAGGTLAPGDGVGTLTIGGDLGLSSGSTLDFQFGQAGVAGGPLNDLVEVGGDLVLDGTINVSVPAGGSFGGGIYRVFNYGGALTDNGLELGIMPTGGSVTVQTAVAGQVNLVNSAGLELSFWDGDAGPKFNDSVDGGSGVWQLAGSGNNWTDPDGSINAAYANGSFAVFAGTGGTVTVDNGNGAVTASGMQFASDGYLITGDPLTLTDTTSAIRVGDGTAAGAGMTATIASTLTGNAQLVKTDAGTLVLTGNNTYTGGTAIHGGTLQISSDANLGDAAGALAFDDGTLRITADTASNRGVTLAGAGMIDTAANADWALAGDVAGSGSLTKSGTGTLVLTGNATHTGGTVVTGGSLVIGNQGTAGSIAGDILNDANVRFSRSDEYTYAGSITGTGNVVQDGAGTLNLTGDSSWGGTALVTVGGLRVGSGNTVAAGNQTNVTRGGLLTVAGEGSTWETGFAGIDSGDGPSTLSVEDGGVFRTTTGGLTLRASPGVVASADLDISGAGSLVDLAGALVASASPAGIANITIADGGSLRSTGANVIGGAAGNDVASTLTISGAGSNWTSTGTLAMSHGAFSLLDGGAASFASASLGSATAARPVTIAVDGAGSRLATSGDLVIGSGAGSGDITLADGGQLSVGGVFTLADGADATGVLSIGGAEGQAATAAGLLDSATLAFGAGTGRVNFNHTGADYLFSAAMSGAGTINQVAGVTRLTGDSSAFAGTTAVSGGTLLVDGTLGGAASVVGVASGGTLGGNGTVGGDVNVADGTLAPGGAPGTLTINGNLALGSGATLAFDFGEADVVGGAFNDLVDVGGDLVLGGTLNVATSAGGSFGPGIYRVFNYGGALSGPGLALGTLPAGTDFHVQTSVDHEVNLVNTDGMALRFWDGAAGGRNDGAITGGDGVWQNDGGNDNWTLDDGSVNAPFLDSAFAVFQGTGGTVTVDEGLGAINVGGMQFAADGYAVEGDRIHLAGTQAIVRVGDGTTAGSGYTATIASELTGSAQLVKSDGGTLVLSGANSYTGGTLIDGGTLQISSDANLGAAAGALAFDGGVLHTTVDVSSARDVVLTGAGGADVDAGSSLVLSGTLSGAGSLDKLGAGTLVLAGTGGNDGGMNVAAGRLLLEGDYSAATGATGVAGGATLGGTGTLGGDVILADGATLAPGADGPGTLTIEGGLSLASGSLLDFEFGEANVAGGALNDLVEVGGDLVLDGTLDVSVPAGGAFEAGVYRVFNYGGALTDNGLEIGTLPGGSDAAVQTSIAGQVNLVNTGGLTLNFWDGAAGPKNDGAVNGGDGLWQNSAGNENWTDANGQVNAPYTDAAFAIFAGDAGTVEVDDSLGTVSASGMQFATDGYSITGDDLVLAGADATIRVGDGSAQGADFTATIGAVLGGDARLVKTDAGTLVLTGDNTYTGGTRIAGGTLQVARDANLGAAARGITLDGGTLATSADLSSQRRIELAGDGAIATAAGTTFTFEGLFAGPGTLTKIGAGTLLVASDNDSHVAATLVAAGTLDVLGRLGGEVGVGADGRLEGTGRVGSVTNAGIVAPGSGGIGTLTVARGYAGNGGALEIEAVLGDDASATDRLVVNGATSGNTVVTVINLDGSGGQTVEGIKIVDVTGTSNGTFTLDGDYEFQGEQAVIAGAFGYRLYKNGVSDPDDGDWYLRSSLLDPSSPNPPTDVYQPGVPVYEGYARTLLALNGLPTLQQRVGNRFWAADPVDGKGVWGRVEGGYQRPEAVASTSATDASIDTWQIQMGADVVLAEYEDGSAVVGGLSMHRGKADAGVASMFGNGSIDTTAYGIGATLTWYGASGLYVDAQAKLSWFESDLDSAVLGSLLRNNDGQGQSVGLEVGKRFPVSGKFTLTPQFQAVYSDVDFDRGVDPAGAIVSADKGSSLVTRSGISFDRQDRWSSASGDIRRAHVYGVANLAYQWRDETGVEVSGTPIASRDRSARGELGFGGSYSWGGGAFTVYGEVSADTPLADFGDAYTYKSTIGFRADF